MATTPGSERAVSVVKEMYRREMMDRGKPTPEVVLVTVDLLVAQREHFLEMVAAIEDQLEEHDLLHSRTMPGVLDRRLR